MLRALVVLAAVLLPWTTQAQQIVKCVGKDGKTYVGSTLPPQCAGQAVDQMNKQGQVVKRTEAMLTPEQRAAKEAEERVAKEKQAEAERKEKEETRKNKALLSTYGSEKDIEVARSRALTDNEKAAWFQAADAVLVPFTAPVAVEPPLTLLEAMACGTAVVVTPHGNQSQLVENGQNGMLYETPAELSARLRDVFSPDPAAMAGLRAAARATIVQRHSLAAATAAATQVWAAVESPERR